MIVHSSSTNMVQNLGATLVVGHMQPLGSTSRNTTAKTSPLRCKHLAGCHLIT